MKEIFVNVINKGNYDLAGLLAKIDTYHIEGRLTDAEREELYSMARKSPTALLDYDKEILNIWAAIHELQKQQNLTDETEGTETNDDYPEYIQPTGAHNTYQIGDRVTFKGNRYTCILADCAWSPQMLPEAWEMVEV